MQYEGHEAAAPEVAVTLIRKEDYKMVSLGDFVHQNGCSTVADCMGRYDDEAYFDTAFSTPTSGGLDFACSWRSCATGKGIGRCECVVRPD